MTEQTTPATRYSYIVEIAVANELGFDADNIADRLFDALAPDHLPCPIFGEIRLSNGHPALLALTITHVASKEASITFVSAQY